MSAFKRLREFVEGEDAKADDIETEFDNIYSVLHQGITTDNIADGGIGPADIGVGAVEQKHLATFFNGKKNYGYNTSEIGTGFAYGAQHTIAHGLGTTPVHVAFTFNTAANYAIAFEGRLIAWNAVNFTYQVICSSAVPGAVGSGILYLPTYWEASGALGA